MNIKMLKAAVTGLVLSVSTIANAGLILDFEDLAISSGTFDTAGDRLSSGFIFDSASDHTHLGNNSVSGNSGSTFLVLDGYKGSDSLNITQTTGGIFSVLSFDLGEFNPAGGLATSIDIIGTFVGGATINTTLTLDGILSVAGSNNFEKFNLGWNNLESISFSASAGSGDSYWAIDNIDTSSTSVPEPSTLAIFALGIMGLVSRRLKNQS